MGQSSPKNIDYLNFDGLVQDEPSMTKGAKTPFMLNISLSKKVTIQKRIVYDVFEMFGDVGGLNDFLILCFSATFGFFSEHFLIASLIQKLFHVSVGDWIPSQGDLNGA